MTVTAVGAARCVMLDNVATLFAAWYNANRAALIKVKLLRYIIFLFDLMKLRHAHVARPEINSIESRKLPRITLIIQDALFVVNNGSFFPTFITVLLPWDPMSP